MSRHAAEDIVRAYLARMPNALTAYDTDPTYRAQVAFLRRTLMTVEMAMEDEGVPEETRLRVLRAVMYGAPDEDAALTRVDQHAALVQAASLPPAFHPLDIDPFRAVR